MTKNELRRVKKAIDLISLLQKDIKEHGIGAVLDYRNAFYHLFYENNGIKELFLFLIPTERLDHIVRCMSTIQSASGYMGNTLSSAKGKGKITYDELNLFLDEFHGYLQSALSTYGINVFYSWQSELSNTTNRSFIEDALEKAIKTTAQEAALPLKLDKDTAGRAGSPDIIQAILDKIDNCFIFVADVSLVPTDSHEKKAPNANVLFELGYAYGVHSDECIIMVFNTDTGKIEDLPFDIRAKRIVTYYCTEKMDPEAKSKEKESLKKRLMNIINQRMKAEI